MNAISTIYAERSFVLLADLVREFPELRHARSHPDAITVTTEQGLLELELRSIPATTYGCTIVFYSLPNLAIRAIEIMRHWVDVVGLGAGSRDQLIDETRAEVDRESARADAAERECDTLRRVLVSSIKDIADVAVALGWDPEQPVEDPGELVDFATELRRKAEGPT
ncbi:MAG TPA: hypothetical protein VM869_19405 [Enhygromyxa sp.]|nr:hypothetical protein [Enhygromyxa sp.]